MLAGGYWASMGPWLRSHGRPTACFRRPPSCGASMGPWLRSHGRGVNDAEAWLCRLLQWGRGFAATEGRVPPHVPRQPQTGFNGAVASQPRKDRQARCRSCGTDRFNGAVASQPRKV